MLDDKSLSQLKAAYAAAPSEALAQVIVTALIDRDELDDVSTYLPHLGKDIDERTFEVLCRRFAVVGNEEDLRTLLEGADTSARADVVTNEIETLARAEKLSPARCLYRVMCDLNDDFSSERLSAMLKEQKSSPVPEDRPEAQRPKLRVVEKTNIAEVTDLERYTQAPSNFDDVVGLENIKKQISKKIILPFQKPSLFQRFKKRIGGGVMLYGPPGCGKTLLARATAGECKATFYNVEISDVLDMYIGESEQKLHAIFEKARERTPSVLFFDEMEALAGKREHSRNSASANVVSQFLTELDGFSQNNQGVLILASTNVPWAIDPAFLRPGRFDRMFFVPPPDRVARQAILQHHMRERPSEQSIDYASLAIKTGGFSGADLANLVEMAADEAIDDTIASGKDVEIHSTHFQAALSDARPTTTEWLTTARNYARYANDGGRYDDVLEFLKKHGK